MSNHEHPDPDTPGWDDPDYCPFCGSTLSDPGVGFLEHLDDSGVCRRRFAEWRANIADDVGGEWSG